MARNDRSRMLNNFSKSCALPGLPAGRSRGRAGTLAWFPARKGHVSLLIPRGPAADSLPRGGSRLSGTDHRAADVGGSRGQGEAGSGRGERERVRLNKYLLI